MLREMFSIAVIGLALSGSPASAQTVPQPVTYASTQPLALTAEEKADLIAKIQEAQTDLRSGARLYFQLLSGAPAAYPMTAMSPRDAFLNASFDQPASMLRQPTDNPSWRPYRLTLTPNGVGNLLWDVEVVLGFNGQIERIEMFYRYPPPF
ncbi:hypothetical protein [Brevundimonas sp.]|uniref:hypothetical protein n=1 Tax=Brevundimonas sp. TaxID=1871086 RepID=UPI002D69D97E|nr:hypothetical protein [Brevundimonas sp.]HYC98088.1 hypothetical protein [Brevundimonas sp.]